MARIAGVELNDKWRVEFALSKIKGIGASRAKDIVSSLKIADALRVAKLSTKQKSEIVTELDKYKTEGDLAREIRENIRRLKDIGSYRGMRHARGLPGRGQRTRSNARTKRGKRKTVGAFRKDELAKMQTTNK